MGEVRLLIIEDDGVLARQLELFFQIKGLSVATAATREEALETLKSFHPQVTILDLGLPPLENSPEIGLSLLPELVKIRSKTIVLTGQSSREAAIRAIRLGAFDYIYKPADPQILDVAVKRAAFLREIEEEILQQEGMQITISRDPSREGADDEKAAPLADYAFSHGLNLLKKRFERDLIEKALKATDFNVKKAAQLLKISRESLYYLMKKHGVKRPK